MTKHLSNRHHADPDMARCFAELRAAVADRKNLARLLQDEKRAAEFIDKGARLVDWIGKLQTEYDELRLMHESILEHATEIENELELHNRGINDDLAVAQKIQHALLPDVRYTIGQAFEVAIYHKQLSKVGGDFYDFFVLPDSSPALGVYDVSGHGISAALVTAYLKAQFAQATKQLRSPSAIVDWVNRSSYSFMREVRHYSSVNFVSFTKEFCRYVTGGGYGVLIRRGALKLFKRTNNVIGLVSMPFEEFELPFDASDTLALYTDGMFAAQEGSGSFYTARRLNEILMKYSEEPVQQLLDRCIKDYLSFRTEDADDVTLIILRRR